jgi:DNA-binding transcriptional MerR regulator
MTPQYTLTELAEKVNIQTRTIRSYISKGLLQGPENLGRLARYSDYHVKRLILIKKMKDDLKIPLSEIRRLINLAGPDEEIHLQILPDASTSEVESEAASPTGEIPVSSPPPDEPLGTVDADSDMSALEFIRHRKALGSKDVPAFLSRKMAAEIRQTDSNSESPIEALLEQLRIMLVDTKVISKSKGEEWVHLEVTPDIQIQVRGQLSSEQLAGFEQLADLMRHILLGRSSK